MNERGFTLIEILMVIIVITILSAIALPSFLNMRTSSQKAFIQGTLRSIRAGIRNGSLQSNLHCGQIGNKMVTTNQLLHNDITEDNTDLSGSIVTNSVSCTSVQIPNIAFRRMYNSPGLFNSAGILTVENPFNNQSKVGDESLGCVGCSSFSPCSCVADADIGWCFDNSTQRIWAASNVEGECQY